MYTWEENTAKRGSVEIYSCMFKWLEDYLFSRPDQYPKKLKIFADNCGGQNKNNNLCLTLLMHVHKDMFERVELSYLVPGHSYNACDRAFGHIQTQYQKDFAIHTPDEYCNIMKISNKKQGEIPVYRMKKEDFLNIEVFVTKKKSTRMAHIKATTGKVFQRATQIVVKKDLPNGYILKNSFNIADECGNLIVVTPPKMDDIDFDLSDVILKPKYSQERKVRPDKITDLKYFLTYEEGKNLQWWENFFKRQEELLVTPEEESEDEDGIPEPPVEQGDINSYVDSLDRIRTRSREKRIDKI